MKLGKKKTQLVSSRVLLCTLSFRHKIQYIHIISTSEYFAAMLTLNLYLTLEK